MTQHDPSNPDQAGDWYANQPPEENPLDELVAPHELAKFLTGVYRDEEASNFERVQAAVALSTFWMGVELERIYNAIEGVPIMTVPGPPPTGGML